jgi:hypothetical protein
MRWRWFMGRHFLFPCFTFRGKECTSHAIGNSIIINIHRHLKSIFLIVSLSLFSYFAVAIPSNATFKNLTTEMGLSHGDVTCFCQDYEGFMWVGTRDGLNRFDGLSFTVFKHNQKDSTSLPNNQIDYLLKTAIRIYG